MYLLKRENFNQVDNLHVHKNFLFLHLSKSSAYVSFTSLPFPPSLLIISSSPFSLQCSKLQNVTSNPRARDKWHKLQSQIAYSFRLMARAAHPQHNRAIFARFGERWTHVLTDQPLLPASERRSIVVVFVATQHGTVRKLGLITANRMCEIEEYRIGEPVSAMKFFDLKARDGTNRVRQRTALGRRSNQWLRCWRWSGKRDQSKAAGKYQR